ncbi:MAG: DivIVA domain [Actinomycetia bacterium]|nr:DivIVA domain [Actinomycetes bacterium]
MPRLSPEDIANRAFATSFRGYAEAEVRSFLKRVSDELVGVREREHELLSAVDELESRLAAPRPLDEKELLDALGEETSRLLRSAREAAADIRGKSEERAARAVEEAQEEAQRLRHEASEILAVRTREAEDAVNEIQRQAEERVSSLRNEADRLAEEARLRAQSEADGIVEGARTQGREMVEEAKALRERVLGDLGRRRGLLQAQLEELRNGRDHLLDAYRTVKRTFLEATEALAQAEARAAAGKPMPSVDTADVEAAIAAETVADAVEPAAADAVADAGEPAVADAPDSPEPAVAEAEAADAAAVEVEVEVDPVEVVDTATSETPAAEAADEDTGSHALSAVDSLFARIRAGAPVASGAAEGVAATDVHAPDDIEATSPISLTPEPQAGAAEAEADVAAEQVEPEPEPAPDVPDGRAQWRAKQAQVIDPLIAPLVKQAKRAAQDEQNALLDALRRHKGRPTSEQVLLSDQSVIESWGGVIRTGLDTAYGAGRNAVGSDAVAAPPDLSEEAVRYLVMALRERLAVAIDDANDGYSTSLVIERIGARYREWKLQSLEHLVEDVIAGAWSRGVFDAVPDGTLLSWVPAVEGRCPDCDDNGLEPTAKGEHFPTGQPHPPAHPGCRCLLAPVDTLEV